MIADFIKYILNKLGFSLNKLSIHRTSMSTSLEFIKKSGFYPKHIIDVGVAYGTPELYNTFKNSNFILIEPLSSFNKYLLKYTKKNNFKLINKCASDKLRSVKLNVREKTSTSSIHLGSSKINTIDVATTTLDSLYIKYKLSAPILVKIDVEGHELNVLKGAQKILDKVDFLIAEVTFNPVLKGACDYLDVINFMQKKNYSIFDIINIRNNAKTSYLSQADIVFKKNK